jgi:hypothetical protein
VPEPVDRKQRAKARRQPTGAAPAQEDLPRHVGELFAAAANGQRATMLACLLRPLNALSLMGVAAGAFAEFLTRKPRADDPRDLDAVSRYSPEQISQLSDFVDQVDRDALVRAAKVVKTRKRSGRRVVDGG